MSYLCISTIMVIYVIISTTTFKTKITQFYRYLYSRKVNERKAFLCDPIFQNFINFLKVFLNIKLCCRIIILKIISITPILFLIWILEKLIFFSSDKTVNEYM